MKTKISIIALAMIAFIGTATAQNNSGKNSESKDAKRSSCYVDANKNGVCDKFEDKTCKTGDGTGLMKHKEGEGKHMRNAQGKNVRNSECKTHKSGEGKHIHKGEGKHIQKGEGKHPRNGEGKHLNGQDTLRKGRGVENGTCDGSCTSCNKNGEPTKDAPRKHLNGDKGQNKTKK